MKSIYNSPTFKRSLALIALASVLAGMFFLWYAAQRQVYTAKAVVACQNSDESEALGEELSTLFSQSNISAAFERFGLELGIDDVRSGGLIEQGENGEFTVSLSLKSGAEDARFALDALLDCWFERRGKALAQLELSAEIPASARHVYENGHDYIEQAELEAGYINTVLTQLDILAGQNPEFVSPQSGYTFGELAREYRVLLNGRVQYIYAGILQNALTKDSDVLLKKYRQRSAIKSEPNSRIFEIFSQNTAGAPAAAVEAELSAVKTRLETLESALHTTFSDYCRITGANGAAVCSAVTVSPRANIWLCAILGAGGVFLGGACLALGFIRAREIELI